MDNSNEVCLDKPLVLFECPKLHFGRNARPLLRALHEELKDKPNYRKIVKRIGGADRIEAVFEHVYSLYCDIEPSILDLKE